MQATAHKNGKMTTGEKLVTSLTEGYKPTLPWDFAYAPDGLPLFQLTANIEYMLWHPVVHTALEYYKSGIAGAEFEVICGSNDISKFLEDQTKRFWDRGVPLLQEGYNYGWMGGENVYSDDEGPLKWDCMHQFAPRDIYLLTQCYCPIGMRVKRVPEVGSVDLWLATDKIPSKALWYTHNPRFGQYYGRSQLWGAWRPWRRAAWKDGAESVIDGGVYRFAYPGPVVRYPDESYESNPGIPATVTDSQGNPVRHARDMARMMAEQAKTGASIGLPSVTYPPDQGGGNKWEIEWPTGVLNVDPLINYLKQLYDQICYGIGVPPELLQAAETGSGFSGRRIPLESFLDQQQHIADQMLQLFTEQVLKPLVFWNFGDGIKFEIKVKRLLETKNKASGGQPGTQQPQDGKPGGLAQPPLPAPPTGKPTPTVSLSMITDRIRDIARRAARKVA
jgi:hypothetical protein